MTAAQIDPLRRRAAVLRGQINDLRPLARAALDGLRAYYDTELTFTSNAIEGNTLTAAETALVLEKGITVAGKPLKDHLEALDHHEALEWARGFAAKATPPDEDLARELHRRIVYRSRPDIAGRYAETARRIVGSSAVFPQPAKIPGLMEAFGAWLRSADADADTAFEAHWRLVAIHPFADGNGRTARLLMNLVLLRGGDPPIAIRPRDRADYLNALEARSATGDDAPYAALLWRRLVETLEDYLAAARAADER